MTDKLYTVTEAAAIIGIKANSLSKRVRAGDVPYAERTNTKYLLSADTVEAERQRVAGVAAGTQPRQRPHKPKPKAEKAPPASPVVQAFWNGNWATIDRQRIAPKSRYDSIGEIVEAGSAFAAFGLCGRWRGSDPAATPATRCRSASTASALSKYFVLVRLAYGTSPARMRLLRELALMPMMAAASVTVYSLSVTLSPPPPAPIRSPL